MSLFLQGKCVKHLRYFTVSIDFTHLARTEVSQQIFHLTFLQQFSYIRLEINKSKFSKATKSMTQYLVKQ